MKLSKEFKKDVSALIVVALIIAPIMLWFGTNIIPYFIR
jgi:hypothetical protein